MEEIKQELEEKFGKHCPNENNCGNEGILAEHGCNGTEEYCAITCPVPVQCEFCYTEPLSIYNIRHGSELISWIASKINEARIAENELWIKEIDSSANLLRSVGLDETSIHRKNFWDRITELKGEK